MIIDVHTHIWPEKVVEKAKNHLETVFNTKLVTIPTPSNLLQFMDKNGIDISVVNSVASRPDQVLSINNWLFGLKERRFRIFAAFHPDHADWREELKRIADNASGIKLQPEFQEFFVDDEKLFPQYEAIAAAGLPILFHCGYELSGTMMIRSGPDRMIKVHERFPNLKIIAAHFGGFRLWEGVEKYLIGKKIWLDTSYTFGQLDKEKLLAMLVKHDKDKILFGTDFPLVDQKQDIDYLNSLALDAKFKQRIFSENTKILLNI
jgi:predicted TIM-barrel fold metal-dependent hydrolase